MYNTRQPYNKILLNLILSMISLFAAVTVVIATESEEVAKKQGKSKPHPSPPTIEETIVNFGWAPNEELADIVADKVPKVNKDQILNLVKFEEENNSSALLYDYLYQVLDSKNQLTQLEKETGRLSALNQGSVGACVGFCTAQALNVLMSVNVIHRKELKRVWKSKGNPDAIYAIGRYEHLGNWDGSVGSWSMEGLKKYGTLHRLKYPTFDITNTVPTDGRKWAKSGLPSDMIKAASDHKLLTFARVENTNQAKALLQNGYPIIVCAKASYPKQRNSDGFLTRTGNKWAHAMAVVAYRGKSSKKEGFLIWNSWGDNWVNGGIFPKNMPHGAFWVSEKDLDYHIRQKDSWALSGYDGFKKRNISWKETFSFGLKISE